jgi:aminopeptidase N
MTNSHAINEGFMVDAKGRHVPLSLVAPIDMARNDLVNDLVGEVKNENKVIAALRRKLFDEIEAFVTLSAELYEVKLGGQKGNVTLTSFDGKYKIVRANQDTLVFDERLQAAKSLIDACLLRWSAGAAPEIKVLINDAFQVDKAGNINTGRVLELRRLAIKDEEWLRAMAAIGDALQVAGSKSYVRVYERDADGKYQPITLDMAGA